jgi:hypothetical protein
MDRDKWKLYAATSSIITVLFTFFYSFFGNCPAEGDCTQIGLRKGSSESRRGTLAESYVELVQMGEDVQRKRRTGRGGIDVCYLSPLLSREFGL